MSSTHDRYLAELPNDWPRRELGQICTQIVSGGTPSRSNSSYWGGSVPWVTPGELTQLRTKYLSSTDERITDLGLASSGATLVPSDSLLVTTRATLGSVALAAMPLATNQGFKTAVFGSEVDPSFGYHLFHRLKPELIRRASGTTFLEISGSQLEQVVVPVPPLPEQRRIAQILDAVDDAIRSTECVVAKLELMKQGLFHDLLTRGIDEEGCVRRSAGENHDLPDGWEWRSLEELGAPAPHAIVDGPFGSNLKSVHYRSSGVPVIQSGFVTSQRWAPSKYVYVDETLFHEQYRSAVRPGDIVMAKIGATCGACAIVPDNHPVGILAGNSLKITVNEECCLRDYLVLVLHRYFETGELSQIRTETAQPAIGLGRLRRLRVRLPPLSEQNRIVAVATAAERRTADENDFLLKLQSLKLGLMDDLLTGRVRVVVGEDAP